MNFLKVTTLLSCLVLASCAVNKEMQATGGSRADGTIKLSYDYGDMEEPVVDMPKALETAKARCKKWGYKDAEPFGGQQSTCQIPGGLSGCAKTLVTVEYQCLGNLK